MFKILTNNKRKKLSEKKFAMPCKKFSNRKLRNWCSPIGSRYFLFLSRKIMREGELYCSRVALYRAIFLEYQKNKPYDQQFTSLKRKIERGKEKMKCFLYRVSVRIPAQN